MEEKHRPDKDGESHVGERDRCEIKVNDLDCHLSATGVDWLRPVTLGPPTATLPPTSKICRGG